MLELGFVTRRDVLPTASLTHQVSVIGHAFAGGKSKPPEFEAFMPEFARAELYPKVPPGLQADLEAAAKRGTLHQEIADYVRRMAR